MNRLLLHSRHLLVVFLLVFPPLAHGAVRPGPEGLVQLAAIAMAGLWAVSMVRARRLELRRTPLDLPIVLFLALAGASAALSVYPWASRIQFCRLLTYALVFFVLVNTLDSRRKVLRLAWVIVLFGAAFATAALTLAGRELLGFETFSRGAGLAMTFVNRNHFAGYLEIVACLGVGLGLAYRGAPRALLLGLSAWVAVAVLFSLSRGGILALAGGLAFLAVTIGLCHRSRKSLMLVAGFLVLVLAAGAGLGPGAVLESVESLEDPLAAGGTRLEFWRGTLDMIAANPWSGSGPGTFVHAYNRYQTEATARWLVDHAHNDYLELAAEFGLPGLLAGLLCLGILFTRGFSDLRPAGRKQIPGFGQAGPGIRSRRGIADFGQEAVRVFEDGLMTKGGAGPRIRSRRLRVLGAGLGALAGCFALAVHSGFEFNAAIPSNALLFSACAALAIAAGATNAAAPASGATTAAVEGPTRIDLRLAERWHWPIYAGILLLATASIAAVASPYLASRYSQQAREAEKQGRYLEASARLRRSIALDPGNGRYPAQLGDLNVGRSMVTGNPAERHASLVRALSAYDQAIPACSVCSPYVSKKARAFERLGRTREAEEALEQAARLAPMNPQAHHDLGRFHLKHGPVERGTAEYRRFLELTEGHLPRILEELWQALPSYSEVEPAVPRRAHARRGFAAFLFDLGHTEDAMRELEAAFGLEPTPDGALLHLRALSTRKQHLAALEAGHEHLHRFGGLPTLRRQMTRTYLELGRTEQAISMVEELLDEQPGSAELYRQLGNLQSAAGRPQVALRIFLKGLELRPQSARLHASLARLHADLGQPGDALAAWKRAVTLQPRTVHYRYQLGKAYRRLGLYNQAVEAWRECLRIDSGHRASELAIARLLEEVDAG